MRVINGHNVRQIGKQRTRVWVAHARVRSEQKRRSRVSARPVLVAAVRCAARAAHAAADARANSYA